MNILALDDEKIALSVLVSAIRSAIPDAEIIPFFQPQAALEYMKSSPVDVVFCDYKMPGLNGIEFGKLAKAIRPATDIVFVTGYGEYAVEAVNTLAPQGYIVKPVSRSKIEAVIGNLHQQTQQNGIYIHTFGAFEVFCKGAPLNFKVRKAKEMLAYLVDRGGATCTRKELTAVLYDGRNEKNAVRYFTDCVKCLTDTLDSVGAGQLLVRRFNSYAVDKTWFQCDLFDYYAGSYNLYRGEYMTQYEWAKKSLSVPVNSGSGSVL